MRLNRPFFLLRLIFPEALFRLNNGSKDLFLTFDDGPCPVTTPGILDVLEANDVKATFFCSGQEAEKYPRLIRFIKSKGHVIGNHGYSHLDGFRTNNDDYLGDVAKAAILTSSYLFRPPYGRIRHSQYRILKKDYRIIFWDLMPFDFDRKVHDREVLKVLKDKVRSGSVIVLHDNESSLRRSILDEFIQYAKSEGYSFRTMETFSRCSRKAEI